MEVLLFALFFISALIFFIAGKDDFGRTGSNLIIKEEEKIKEMDKVIEEGKTEDKVVEEGKKEDEVVEEGKTEDKVVEEGTIEPQEELKKES